MYINTLIKLFTFLTNEKFKSGIKIKVVDDCVAS